MSLTECRINCKQQNGTEGRLLNIICFSLTVAIQIIVGIVIARNAVASIGQVELVISVIGEIRRALQATPSTRHRIAERRSLSMLCPA